MFSWDLNGTVVQQCTTSEHRNLEVVFKMDVARFKQNNFYGGRLKI